MKRVTSLGGIFFKCEDPQKVKEWYAKHLGFVTDDHGAVFEWRKAESPDERGYTAWSPFSQKSTYFEPSKKDFMFNYRVEDLEKLLEVLREEGVEVVGEIEAFDYGKFAHIIDVEGNKVELWEPVDPVFTDYYKDATIK